MLYTSYFAKQKNNTTNDLYAITVVKPSFFSGKHLSIVAPSSYTLNRYKSGMIDEEEYTEEYLQTLEDDKENILKTISSLPDNSILLCYEGKDKFCHRHILAKWLKDNKIEIEEID